jgi:Mrp family chromosome partitioning ATPase
VGLSDARLICSLVDELVYIVCMQIAPKQDIVRALDIITSIQTPVLGMAINKVDNYYSNYHKHYQHYQDSNDLPSDSNNNQILKVKDNKSYGN